MDAAGVEIVKSSGLSNAELMKLGDKYKEAGNNTMYFYCASHIDVGTKNGLKMLNNEEKNALRYKEKAELERRNREDKGLLEGFALLCNAALRDNKTLLDTSISNNPLLKNINVVDVELSNMVNEKWNAVYEGKNGAICAVCYGSIKKCTAEGAIVCQYLTDAICGGICGLAIGDVEIERCKSNVDITALFSSSGQFLYCGGVCGSFTPDEDSKDSESGFPRISECCNYGNLLGGYVEGNYYYCFGGICGKSTHDLLSITNSYNIGNISASSGTLGECGILGGNRSTFKEITNVYNVGKCSISKDCKSDPTRVFGICSEVLY